MIPHTPSLDPSLAQEEDHAELEVSAEQTAERLREASEVVDQLKAKVSYAAAEKSIALAAQRMAHGAVDVVLRGVAASAHAAALAEAEAAAEAAAFDAVEAAATEAAAAEEARASLALELEVAKADKAEADAMA